MHLYMDRNNDDRRWNNFVFVIPSKLYACGFNNGIVCTSYSVPFCFDKVVKIRRLYMYGSKIQFQDVI